MHYFDDLEDVIVKNKVLRSMQCETTGANIFKKTKKKCSYV